MTVKAVLLDIDGTITKAGTNKVHHDSFTAVFKEIYGIETTRDIVEYDGKTDKWILFAVLKKKGLSEDEIRSKMVEAFDFIEEYFRKNFKAEELIMNPGVKELISSLKKRGHIVGVLTGNLEKIGWTKMEYAGLKKYLDLGIFGNMSGDRLDLIEEGIREIKAMDSKIDKKDIYVIDDAPTGIGCGNKAEVKTIVMLTGKFSIGDFNGLKPSYIFKDFSDTAAIIEAIEKG